MSMRRLCGTLIAAVLAAPAVHAHTAPYPTTTCVASKQRTVAGYCEKALRAWARFDDTQDSGKRNATISGAAARLAARWARAETFAERRDVDCKQTTLTSEQARGLVDS